MIKRINNFLLLIFLFITVFTNSTLALDLKDLDVYKYFEPENIPELSKDKPARIFGQLNKKELDIGDPFEYTITVYQRSDAKVKLEKIEKKKDSEDEKSVIEDNKPDKKTSDNLIISKKTFKNIKYNSFKEEIRFEQNKNLKITKHTYYLQPEYIEDVRIPSFDAIVNGKKITLPEVTLHPKTLMDKNKPMKDIHDIKPIEEYFIFHWEWLFFPLLLLLFLILVVVLIIFVIKNLPSQNPVKDIKLPHQIAYERLNKLKGMNLESMKDFDIFYTKLSEIMREYLEGRFYIQAIEMTTEEITGELLMMNLNLKTRKMITSVLNDSDLVKFAKFLPDKKHALDNIMIAYKFIDITKLDFSLINDKEEK